jgi:UDP-N-acetylmuramate dehydrogenase
MLLAQLTTLRVGGPAERFVEANTVNELVDAVLDAEAHGEPWFVLGGGSNVLIGDDGVEGLVVRVATSGIERLPDVSGSPRPVRLRVQAGESWDALVEHTVRNGWGGMEALSGIPGSTGAAPIQNIGAYGQELGESLVSLEVLDVDSGEQRTVPAPELGLGYRTSAIKQGWRAIVLSVDFALERTDDAVSRPIAYAQLADSLGIAVGERAPLAGVRAAVLALRASKGMVLDTHDPYSVSAGSFFTNPIVSESFARGLPPEAPRWPQQPDEPALAVSLAASLTVPLGHEPAAPPEPVDGTVKLSAAWLIEHAGITRGFALPGSGASVSQKHTLALTNASGHASAADVAELARYIQIRVMSQFGVTLHPEPVFVGIAL